MNAAIRAVFLSGILAGLISCSETGDDTDDQARADDADRSSVDDAMVDDTLVNVESDSAPDDGLVSQLIADDATADASEVVTSSDADEGSNTDEPVSDEDPAYVGIVVVADMSIEAEFFAYPSSDSSDVPVELSAIASHLCQSSSRRDIVSMQVDSAVVPRSIDAGEVIVLTGQDGTFVELARRRDEGQVRYTARMNTGGIGKAPDRLVVDIPGHDFPTFPPIEIPSPSSSANDESASEAAPDSHASASSSAISNSETNPDGQEAMVSDTSASVLSDESGHSTSVPVQQVSCTTIQPADNARKVDTVDTVIVKKVLQGEAMLLVFRLLT